MRKSLFTATAAALAATMAFGAAPAMADDAATPELRSVNWYRLQFIKWKENKGRRAHEIIETFEKVDAALGWNDVIDFHMGTGEWHSIVAIRMRGGIAEMGWRTNPDGEKWDAELARQLGGEDKAKALMEEFEACIEEQRTEIGHIDIEE
ncbi:MAG: hypothetical protein ACO25F_08975 [Erythrobacter sp.]